MLRVRLGQQSQSCFQWLEAARANPEFIVAALALACDDDGTDIDNYIHIICGFLLLLHRLSIKLFFCSEDVAAASTAGKQDDDDGDDDDGAD